MAALKFKKGLGPRDVMREDFFLRENPFKVSQVYNPDDPGTYEPRMYGDQLAEFRKKFFVVPLMKERNRQVIGAVWSSQASSDWRGFGKSMLMAEESKKVDADLGASMLQSMGVETEDATQNPILAGYCTFDQAKGVKSFAAALLDAVAFILEQNQDEGTVHAILRNRAAAEAEEGFESESVRLALLKKVRSYKGLNLQLSHKTLSRFIDLLSGDDTNELTYFIRNDVGPRIKANEGFNFVHIFNAFAVLAGVVHITFFIDQIENFAKFVRNQDRDVKILRESMCQTSPTSEMASFVFQMHGHALEAIEDWWEAEHLPSLDFQKRINATRTINLKGLETQKEAKALATSYLAAFRMEDAPRCAPLHPFPDDVIEAVRADVNGNPRRFLEKLGAVLENAVAGGHQVIDLVFVEPLLNEDYQDDSPDEGDDEFDNPLR